MAWNETIDYMRTAFTNAFGHPFLAGAVLLIVFFYAMVRAGMPGSAAAVISAVVLIGLAGFILPAWFMVFVGIGVGVILAVGIYKILLGG